MPKVTPHHSGCQCGCILSKDNSFVSAARGIKNIEQRIVERRAEVLAQGQTQEREIIVGGQRYVVPVTLLPTVAGESGGGLMALGGKGRGAGLGTRAPKGGDTAAQKKRAAACSIASRRQADYAKREAVDKAARRETARTKVNARMRWNKSRAEKQIVRDDKGES